jgi:hypothetical protein
MKQRNPWDWRGMTNATQEGEKPQGDLGKHPSGSKGGKASEAGSRDSHADGGEAEAKEEEVTNEEAAVTEPVEPQGSDEGGDEGGMPAVSETASTDGEKADKARPRKKGVKRK